MRVFARGAGQGVCGGGGNRGHYWVLSLRCAKSEIPSRFLNRDVKKLAEYLSLEYREMI